MKGVTIPQSDITKVVKSFKRSRNNSAKAIAERLRLNHKSVSYILDKYLKSKRAKVTRTTSINNQK